MKKILKGLVVFSFVSIFSLSAHAVQVNWTDWTVETSSSSAIGELVVGTTTVAVTYTNTAPHAFVQTGAGTNYWTGSAYTNGTVNNAPPAAEQIALSAGGLVTISFSETIVNPYIAMNSWNGNVVDFGVPIIIDSFGSGFWGSGTATLNGTGTGFTGNGEFHGVISLIGSFDSISFTNTSEGWHGFTIGVAGLADNNGGDIPEPAPLALLGLGLLGLAFMRKRRR